MRYCNEIQWQYSLAFPVQFSSVIVRNAVEADCEICLAQATFPAVPHPKTGSPTGAQNWRTQQNAMSFPRPQIAGEYFSARRVFADNAERKKLMPGKGHNIIVVGTSAGGMEALDDLIGQLSTDLPASIFIVQHMAPESTGEALLHRLRKHKSFGCQLAKNGQPFKPGRIYIAPPDNHLLVKKRTLLVTKGARENRSRPGIDPLFRSAAVTHGPSVVGVVLTGKVDDGTAGLIANKGCGGVTVVQDPKEAAYPAMPQSALDNLKVDYCVPLSEMGHILEKLTHERPRKD